MDKFDVGNKILIAFLTASLLLIFFLPANDPDFGWHYRCGEQALTQRKLCIDNNFSYFLPDYQWAYSGLIYDVTLAWIFDNFGFIGISLLGSIIFTLIFLTFYFLLKGAPLLKVAAIFLVILLSQDTFSGTAKYHDCRMGWARRLAKGPDYFFSNHNNRFLFCL